MSKKLMPILVLLILISLVPVTLSRDYAPIDCRASGYCYMASPPTPPQNTVLTNNPRIKTGVNIRPKGSFTPLLTDEDTYLANTAGTKVASGLDDFTTEKQDNGLFDLWVYDYKDTNFKLTNGIYAFHTKLRAGGITTGEFTFTDIIDAIPPSIENIKIYAENAALSSNIIEKDTDFSINATVKDDDGVADTVVQGVKILINTSSGTVVLAKTSMDSLGNDKYSKSFSDLAIDDYTTYIYAYDTLSDGTLGNVNLTIYPFSIKDTEGPGITLTDPVTGFTPYDYPTIRISVTENATCKLLWLAGSLYIGDFTTTDNITHSYTLTESVSAVVPPPAYYNISCTDRYGINNSIKINLTVLKNDPSITSLVSTRGNLITSRSGAEITTLQTQTDELTKCRFKGFKTIDVTTPPTYNSMTEITPFDYAPSHSQDITEAITDLGINNNFTFFVTCENLAGRLSDNHSIQINVSLGGLAATAITPLPSIRNNDPVLSIGTNQDSLCDYNDGTWKQFSTSFSTSHSVQLTSLSEVTHTYPVRCYKGATYASTTDPRDKFELNIIFTVDFSTTQPAINSITNSKGKSVINSNTDSLNITVIGTVEPDSTVTVYVNGTTIKNTTNITSSGTFSVNIQLPAQEKRYYITVNVTDKAENNNTFGYTDLEYTFVDVDRTGPALPVIWGLDSGYLPPTNQDKVNIIGYIGEAGWIKAYTYEPGALYPSYYNDTLTKPTSVNHHIIDVYRDPPETNPSYSQDYVWVLDSDMFKITNADYVTFSSHSLDYFKRYDIYQVSNIEPYRETKVFFTPNLIHDVAFTEDIFVHTEEYPSGWFNLSVQLNQGLNQVILQGNDTLGNDGGHISINIFMDNVLPTAELIVPEQTTNNNLTEIKIRLNGTYSNINQDSVILKIDNTLRYNKDNCIDSSLCLLSCAGEICDLNFRTNKQYATAAHKLNITVADTLGNLLSQEIEFTIDIDIPSEPIIDFTNNKTYNNMDYIISDSTTITATFIEEVNVVEAKIDSTIITPTTQTSKIYQYDRSVTDGPHTFSIRANLAGNAPFTFTKEFVVDQTGPTIVVNHPLGGAQQEATYDILLNLTVTEQTAIQSVSYSITNRSSDTVATGTLTQSDGYHIKTINPTNFNSIVGELYTITYSAADVLGNLASHQTDSFIVKDTLGPLIKDFRPNTIQTTKEGVLISANISDISGIKDVQFAINGYDPKSVPELVVSGNTYSYTITFANNNDFFIKDESEKATLPNNQVTITATDNFDKTTVQAFEFSIHTQAAQLENVYLTNGATNRYFNSGAVLNIDLTSFNKLCAEFSLDTIIVPSSNITSIIAAPGATPTLKCYNLYSFPSDKEQSYKITLSSDIGFDYMIEFTIDLTPPTILLDSQIPSRTTQQTITLNGTVTDERGVASVNINGAPATMDGTYFEKQYTLPEGTYSFKINATDFAGNENITIKNITIDLSGPTKLDLDTLPSITNNSSLQISGVTNASAVVRIIKGITPTGIQTTANPEEKYYGQAPLAAATTVDSYVLQFNGDRTSLFAPGNYTQVGNDLNRLLIIYSDYSALGGTSVELESQIGQVIPSGTVQIKVYNTSLPQGRFTLPAITLEEGENNLRIIPFDDLENPGMGAERQVSIILDTTPPTAQLIEPSTLTNKLDTPIVIELDGTGTSIDQTSIELKINNTLVCPGAGCTITSGNLTTLTYQKPTSFVEGFYNLSIRYSDNVGLTSVTEWTVEINPSISLKPQLWLEDNSIKIGETWYTTEASSLNIIVNYTEDVTLNNYSILHTPNYYLEKEIITNNRKFNLSLKQTLAENTYIFRVNSSKVVPPQTPTPHDFNLVIDLTGPTFSNINVPAIVSWNTQGAITLTATDQAGVSHVVAVIDGTQYNMQKDQDAFTLSTSSITLQQDKFTYSVSFIAYDMLGNQNTNPGSQITFTDGSNPVITLIHPATSYTNEQYPNLTISTDDPCNCNFSWTGTFPGIEFATTNRTTHYLRLNMAARDQYWYNEIPYIYYVYCRSIFGLETTSTFQITGDTTAPTIDNVVSAKLGYYVDNLQNTITVWTNELTRCTYSDSFDSSVVSFGQNYQLINTITDDFENGFHSLTINCKDKAGNLADPQTVEFTVDTLKELEILANDTVYTDKYALRATTNKIASCTFNNQLYTSNITLESDKTYYRYEYDLPINVADGDYIYEVRCDDGATTIYVSISFTVDRTPPAKPSITYPTTGMTFTNTVKVNGTTDEDATRVRLYIDGTYKKEIQVNDQKFEEPALSLDSLNEGNVEISITAMDEFDQNGESAAATVSIEKDTTSAKPTLIIPFVYTNRSQIIVAGLAESYSTIYYYVSATTTGEGVWVNSTTAINSGLFEAKVNLSQGINYIYVKSWDSLGNGPTDSDRYEVVYDTTPPALINNQPTGSLTYSDNVDIKITAEDDYTLNQSSIILTIDGQTTTPSTVDSGISLDISAIRSFTTESHTIYASIKDLAGNKAEFSWTFTTFIPYQCMNNRDDDGDGLIDYLSDPGCDTQSDNDESNPLCGPLQKDCWDCIDNEPDGFTDYLQDTGCSNIADNNERDGTEDDDGDGIINNDDNCRDNYNPIQADTDQD
ncbi:MAG: hypothetical protein ABIJ08_01290, partial [Nanoarchaeota archaeon]